MVRHPFHERVQMALTPPAGEGQLLFGRERLVAEEDHQMLEQSGAHFSQHVIGQVTRKIDTLHLGAKASGDWVRFDVVELDVA